MCQEIKRKFDEIVDFAGVERYLDTPVKRYSSGMMVRLGFAVAAHLDEAHRRRRLHLALVDADMREQALQLQRPLSDGQLQIVAEGHHADPA